MNNMTISEDEIEKDYLRFIRHEAMRANTTQAEVSKIISSYTSKLP